MQFIITQSKKLYTWGASPQLIRLNNQARKRARMAQKFEETKTVMLNDSEVNLSTDNGEPAERVREENIKNITFGMDKVTLKDDLDSEIITNESIDKNVPIIKVASINEDNNKKLNSFAGYDSNGTNGNDEPTSSTSSLTDTLKNILPTQPKIEARIKKLLKVKCGKNGTNGEELIPEAIEDKITADSSRAAEEALEEEYTDHLYPTLVDTSEVAGDIVQVSVN